MPVRLSCPYCNTAFDLPLAPASGRVPCPRCGEGVPVKAATGDDTPLPVPSLNGEPTPVAAPSSQPPAARSFRPLALVAIGLTLLVVVAFGVWFAMQASQRPPTRATTPEQPPVPPATKPPALLSGLKYLPRDAQVVAAVQPTAVIQYAERAKLPPKDVFAELGVPGELLDELSAAGIGADRIDHLAVAASVTGLRAAAVLVLRQPIRDDDRFRKALHGRVDPDHPDRTTVSVAGVPRTLTMVKADDRTYLFVSSDADAALAKAPTAGFADLRDGVKASIGRLSAASFAWAATDAEEWSKVKGVELAAKLTGRADAAKTLDGVRAAAVGVSLEEGGLRLTVAEKSADAKAAADAGKRMTESLAAAKAEVTTAGEWSTAVVPFDPPKDAAAVLKKALGR